MFDGIFEAIEEWMRGLLTGMVESNLTTMFTDVNEKTGEIAAQVGQTPQGWNGSIFSLIQNLSDSVIVPIAGMIITFVLCYELISMFTEKNNMHEVDTWMFFKYFFKMWVAVYLVSHMVPAFLFAMYEKDGMPLEKILFHIIQVKLQRPAVRKYEIENFYEKEENLQTERKKKGGKPDGRQNG